MELYIRICILLLGTLLYSIPRFHECRKLEGYNFPVYSTEVCPRNESEWNKRSSALNCNETYGYTCLPNEHFTELLEFCYTQSRIWIEAGLCLVLVKNVSLVHGYKCHDFIYGCPSSSYLSTSIFDYPTCIYLRNGCFLAEPTCKSKKTHLQDTTDVILEKHDGKTTPYPQKTTKQIAAENVQTNHNSLWIILVILGALILGIVFSIGVIYMYLKRRKKTLPFKKNQIRQWKKENSDFYSTQVCKDVEQRLKTHSVVMVIGHPGTGKSAIIQHIALQYKKKKWILEPLQSIMDFEKTYSNKKKTIYVINDLFGKGVIKKKEREFWRSNKKVIKCCLTKSCSKMIMSCQKYNFLDSRIKRLFEDCSCVVECKLTIDEKKQFLSNYTTDMDFADKCANKVEIEAYFPKLCKLYHEKHQKEGLRFFLEPEEDLKREMMELTRDNKELFCALIILAISNDNLCKEHLHKIVHSELNEYILKECGVSEITPFSITEKFDSMDGFLVKKKNPDNTDGTNFNKDTNIYMFYNEVVRRVTESCFEDIITLIKKKINSLQYNNLSEYLLDAFKKK